MSSCLFPRFVRNFEAISDVLSPFFPSRPPPDAFPLGFVGWFHHFALFFFFQDSPPPDSPSPFRSLKNSISLFGRGHVSLLRPVVSPPLGLNLLATKSPPSLKSTAVMAAFCRRDFFFFWSGLVFYQLCRQRDYFSFSFLEGP